ncbi:hypothetical protein [Niallia taxi]|uniref:Uncharacterized protein n=1 Tax=Niallia taxi TaxID=2499688 RepID=A0A437KBD3_9BACI|nr:hypothetical protein [Niallia taxi]RVT62781.1 hypothetical protein EM808_13665 [Niallia taxi]
MREINALFIDSGDSWFEGDESKVKIMAPNAVLSWKDDGMWAFRVLDEEISDRQDELVIDLAKCASVFVGLESTENGEITAEFLATASFIEVIQKLANKKPGDAGTSTSNEKNNA